MGLAAAIGIAEVAFSATAILQSVAIVGAVVSVVGGVTKDKTLTMIGAGLGLVGGIGALATGALGLSNAALFGAETAAPAAGDVAATVAGVAGDAAAGAGDLAASAAPDVLGALGTEGTTAFDPAAAFAGDPGAALAGASDANPGLIGTSSTTAEDAGAAAAAAPSTEDAAAVLKEGVPRAPFDLGSTSTATGQNITSAIDPATGLSVSPAGTEAGSGTGIGGTLGKFMDYASAHPMLAFGAVQGASSLLSGWTSTLTPAQVAALNAQAAANQAAANLSTTQQANLAMPKAVASSAPVTGQPQTLVPPVQQQPGFINQAPAMPVTGKVAA